MTLEVVLSLFVLLLISIGTYFASQRLRLPYTVLLVLVGSLIVPLSRIPFFEFLRAFQLTPELLFYIFLPILIFESSYNMRARDLMTNIRAVSWLSVGSLLLSMVFIAGALYFAFNFIGLPIPFIVTLLFGALISATDPVAVLALFKEYGVPRRLTFLFEGESLFNDGTSLAMFLIILEVILKGFHGISTVLEGIFMFATMVFGGVSFGLLMGFIFAKLIEKVENNEHIEITLTMLVAHLTFIFSEVLSEHLSLFGHEIKLSSIIATVIASMVIGNYGRSKLSLGVTHFMERFWGYFAFIANSLVFITMGLLFAGLPIDFTSFILPIFLSVLIVIVGRAFSIYPIVMWLNGQKKEKNIPKNWQHLLAWGSLRGALAVIMVMLIPNDLAIPGWSFDFTVKEFITALTIGCIYFTLFVKATTIGSLIKKFSLSELSPIEKAAYRQSRLLIFSFGLKKIKDYFEKKYINEVTYKRIQAEVEKKRNQEYAQCESIIISNENDFEKALRMYALGIEKHFLQLLFKYREVSEKVYKQILVKLDVQLERVEEGETQVLSLKEEFTPDWFEQIASFFRALFLPEPTTDMFVREKFMYYRAQEIITRKAIKELNELKNLTDAQSVIYASVVERVITDYRDFQEDAHAQKKDLEKRYSETLIELNGDFGTRSLTKAFEEGKDGLIRKNMLPQKLIIILDKDFANDES